MRFIFLVLFLSTFLAFPLISSTMAQEYEQGAITVSHVWARATPLGSKVGVAYLQIAVKKGSSDTLLSVSSPVAGKVEIHTHLEEDGILKMRHLKKLPLAGGDKIIFKPSGLHLMLFDLKEQLEAGKKFALTLQFEKVGSITVGAIIEPAGSQGETMKERK